jgi:hypothetical protein
MARKISPINEAIQLKRLEITRHLNAMSAAKEKRIVLQNDLISLVQQKKAGKK